MSPQYLGFIVPIQFGQLGVQSDLSQPTEPPFSLILGNNCQVRYGGIQKCPGSKRWNAYPLPAAVIAAFDWWPDDQTQRLIVCCADGVMYRFENEFSSHVVDAVTYGGVPMASSDGNTPTMNFSPDTMMVAGGSEANGEPRKLFVFSGNDQVQVIVGDATTRRDILMPAADWVLSGSGAATTTGGYPTTGVIYQGSLYATGNKNLPSMVYASDPTNQEDFSSSDGAVTLTNVFPGDSEKIVNLFVWKSRLYLTKFPKGLYYLDTSGTAPVPVKIGDSFGGIGHQGQQQVLDDMLIANSAGSITSLKAVFSLGETEQGDLIKSLAANQSLIDMTTQSANAPRQMIYYENKKQIFVTYSSTGYTNDTLLLIDFQGQNPCLTWYTKDQPNCLFLMKNYRYIPEPYYGSNDGYVYFMDSKQQDVGYYDSSLNSQGTAYLSEFQTPHLDFNWVFAGVSSSYQEKDKLWDYVGITYESRGNWTISADVFVDNAYKTTLTFPMTRGTFLDGQFRLDDSLLNGTGPMSNIQPVGAMGRRISVRFYSDGFDQDFRIITAVFYFRPAGQNNSGKS